MTILKKINLFLFEQSAKKHLRNRRNKRFVDYDGMHSVLLLFESDWMERNRAIRAIVNELQQNGKNVCAWGYCDKKEITSATLPTYRVLGQKDVNWRQCPVASLAELSEQHFDAVIDLSIEPILPLQYLLLHANADCKMGNNTSPALLDFTLSCNLPAADSLTDNQDAAISMAWQQLRHYLTQIKAAQ